MSSTQPRLGSQQWLGKPLPRVSTRSRSAGPAVSRSTTVRAGRSSVANTPRPAMSDRRSSTAGWSRPGAGSGTGQELCQAGEQALDVAVVVVGRQPDPEPALGAETEALRGLV